MSLLQLLEALQFSFTLLYLIPILNLILTYNSKQLEI